jgi:hypothetical protein
LIRQIFLFLEAVAEAYAFPYRNAEVGEGVEVGGDKLLSLNEGIAHSYFELDFGLRSVW